MRAADTAATLCILLSVWKGDLSYLWLSLVMLGLAVHEMIGLLTAAAAQHNRVGSVGYYARGVSAPIAFWLTWAVMFIACRCGLWPVGLLGFVFLRVANQQYVRLNAMLGTRLFKTW